jgi:hypothetical protein
VPECTNEILFNGTILELNRVVRISVGVQGGVIY